MSYGRTYSAPNSYGFVDPPARQSPLTSVLVTEDDPEEAKRRAAEGDLGLSTTLDPVSAGYYWAQEEGERRRDYVRGITSLSAQPIVWLGDKDEFQFQLGHVTTTYGNEPTTAEMYTGAAIAIDVPKWPRSVPK